MHHTAHNSADMVHVYLDRETKRPVHHRLSQKTTNNNNDDDDDGALTTQL
jgi:hypothetical protein